MKAATKKRTAKSQTSLTFIVTRSIWDISPSPENDKLYRPVDPTDPEIVALAASIGEHGLREPIVVTLDGWILSGHRRHAAAKLAGLQTVPCRIERFRRMRDPDRFLRLLREYNRQRDKTADEKVREELVTMRPGEAYQSLIEHRRAQSKVVVAAMSIVGTKRRKRITDAKQPMLDAILTILTERRSFWPLSDRQIHYALLNAPPLKHARKPTAKKSPIRSRVRCVMILALRPSIRSRWR